MNKNNNTTEQTVPMTLETLAQMMQQGFSNLHREVHVIKNELLDVKSNVRTVQESILNLREEIVDIKNDIRDIRKSVDTLEKYIDDSDDRDTADVDQLYKDLSLLVERVAALESKKQAA